MIIIIIAIVVIIIIVIVNVIIIIIFWTKLRDESSFLSPFSIQLLNTLWNKLDGRPLLPKKQKIEKCGKAW